MDVLDDLTDPVQVTAVFNRGARSFVIRSVIWRRRTYPITESNCAYTTRKGRTLLHTYHATGEGIVFRLVLDTDVLAWTVTGVHDHANEPHDLFE